MNKSKTHSKDAMMVARQHEFNQQEWNSQQYKAALMAMITMVATLGMIGMMLAPTFLPAPYAGMVMSIGPAIYMTTYLCLYPNSLRNSSGSLFTAVCLVAWLWLSAVGVTVASLLGIII